jgi:hypothetical protein
MRPDSAALVLHMLSILERSDEPRRRGMVQAYWPKYVDEPAGLGRSAKQGNSAVADDIWREVW